MSESDPAGVYSEIVDSVDGAQEELSALDYECMRQDLNDYGNGQRLLKRHGRDLAITGKDMWYAWDGKRWSMKIGKPEARRRAHRTARAIRTEAGGKERTGKKPAECPQTQHLKFAATSGNSNRISAMLAEAVPYLVRESCDFDQKLWKFNVQNGTLRMSPDGDCELVDYERQDLMTLMAATAHNPKATAPKFMKLLEFLLPDKGVRRFMQAYFGYCLTGSQVEQCMVFAWGEGQNGKSTLMDAIATVFGDYHATIPVESLLQNDFKGGGDATPDIAKLPGKRFVTTSEPEINARLSESFVKKITGGEEMTVRPLYEDQIEFKPQFKLAMSCNHKPQIRGQDKGIWRRMRIVPFEAVFCRENIDLGEGEAAEILRAESDGILNWLLEGFRIWCAEGLKVPEVIQKATEEYRSDADPVGQFLAACIEKREGTTVSAKTMYEAYCAWCGQNAMHPFKQTAFGRTLADRGFRKEKAGTVVYIGVELVHDPRAKDDDHPAHAEGAPPHGDPLDDEDPPI